MIDIKDVRIGQVVYYIDKHVVDIKSFEVNAIIISHSDKYQLCSNYSPNSHSYTNLEDCYSTISEAKVNLIEFCKEKIVYIMGCKIVLDKQIQDYEKIITASIEELR